MPILLAGLRSIGRVRLAQGLIRLKPGHRLLVPPAGRVDAAGSHGIGLPLSGVAKGFCRSQRRGASQFVELPLAVEVIHLLHEDVLVLLQVVLVETPLLHGHTGRGLLGLGLLNFVRATLAHRSPHKLI